MLLRHIEQTASAVLVAFILAGFTVQRKEEVYTVQLKIYTIFFLQTRKIIFFSKSQPIGFIGRGWGQFLIWVIQVCLVPKGRVLQPFWSCVINRISSLAILVWFLRSSLQLDMYFRRPSHFSIIIDEAISTISELGQANYKGCQPLRGVQLVGAKRENRRAKKWRRSVARESFSPTSRYERENVMLDARGFSCAVHGVGHISNIREF